MTTRTNPIPQEATRSRPRGAGPGSHGQTTSRHSAANPKRMVTMPPVVRSCPTTMLAEYTPAHKGS